jgi:FkbM family methyltransferase
MNAIERVLDDIDPSLSVRLRALKKRWQSDWLAAIMKDLVRPGDLAVDIGANRGLYTFILSRCVGRSGRVHAVEPFPGNAKRLRTLARRRGNVTFHPVALSDRKGEAELCVPVHRGRPMDALATLRPSFQIAYDRVRVPISTLDDLLGQETGRVRFVKCDVEGHEDSVLRGGAVALSTHLPTIVVEIEQRHRETPVDEALAYLLGLGYAGYFLDSDGVRPISQFDVHRHQLSFLTGEFFPGGMPVGYVNDFLFVAPGTQLDRVAARR